MNLARKLNMGRKPVLFAVAILSMAAGSLHGQDILKANPEFWGRNAFQAKSAVADIASPNGAQPNVSPQSASVGPATDSASLPATPQQQTATHQTVAHQSSPSQTSETVNAARAAEKKGDITAARSLYEQALQQDPMNRVALLSFARMLHRTGELDASIGMYYRSLEYHRDDPVAMNDLSLCYARKGELRHALAMMNGAISLKPDSARYRNNIAKLLLELDRPTDAFAHLVEASGPVVGHYNMAKLLGQRGKTAEAIQYLEIATQMDPTFEPATLLLAQARAQPQTSGPAPTSNLFTRLPAVEDAETTKASPESTVDGNTAIASLPNTTTNLPANSDPATVSTTLPNVQTTASANSDAIEPQGTVHSTATLDVSNDDGLTLWEPGSIRLQSAELVDELNDGAVDWAVDFEELELAPTSAPVPFENQRRYIKTQNSADSVGRFLDGFK